MWSARPGHRGLNSSCRPAADNQAGSLMNALMEPADVL